MLTSRGTKNIWVMQMFRTLCTAMTAGFLALSMPGAAAQAGAPIWDGAYVGVFVGHTSLESQFGSNDGVNYGVYGGYNHTTDRFLLGVEGDFAIISSDTGDGYEASLLARGGLVLDHLLLYATAGVSVIGDDNFDSVGFIVGGGAEYMFTPSIIGRAEGLYGVYDDAGVNNNVDVETFTIRGGIAYKF